MVGWRGAPYAATFTVMQDTPRGVLNSAAIRVPSVRSSSDELCASSCLAGGRTRGEGSRILKDAGLSERRRSFHLVENDLELLHVLE